MPLDDILFKTPVKRKAISVVNTKCRFCGNLFKDKYYKGERKHKVRCTRCNLVNAEVDIDDYMKVLYQGLRYDMGTYGDLGGFSVSMSSFKKLVKRAFDLKTDAEVQLKLDKWAYGFKFKQKMEMERKKREPKITIKHKGEPERKLTE